MLFSSQLPVPPDTFLKMSFLSLGHDALWAFALSTLADDADFTPTIYVIFPNADSSIAVRSRCGHTRRCCEIASAFGPLANRQLSANRQEKAAILQVILGCGDASP